MNANVAEVRLFLAKILPWPQEGDEGTAYVNIHNTFTPDDMSKVPVVNGKPKLPWTGRATKSLDDAVKAVKFALKSDTSRDVYFCTSTQSYAEPKVSQRGFAYLKPVRSQENVVKLKSLFLDIDLKGGDHGYDSVSELIAALGGFLKAVGLPQPSIMVHTGGGFHIYWTLATAVDLEGWMAMSSALAEAVRQHGLKCDNGVTIDAARVLRVPQTLNYKYAPPRPVKVVGTPLDFDYTNERIQKALEPYKVSFSLPARNGTILPPRLPIQGVSELAAGIDSPATNPVVLDSLVHDCAFIAEALATGGAKFTNPLWSLTTLLSTFTEGTRQDAHRMAMGHPDYAVEDTNALFDRKQEDKLSKNLGWPSCRTIAMAGCAACATCAHFPENKSPLNFGQKVAPAINLLTNPPQSVLNSVPNMGAAVADADLPDGYRRTPDGVVLYMEELPDGSTTWMPVSRYPMKLPWLQRDPWSLNFTTSTELGKQSQIKVPTKDVETPELKKALQEQGFMVTGRAHGFSILSEFLMSWITKLQASKDAVITSVPFGWLVRQGKTYGFVFGGLLHTPTGTEVASNTDPELARQFQPTGDIMAWKDAAKMITQQRRPALDAIVASAFGAPLVRFTGHQGLLMSAYSTESGIGKSTALKVAQAVWGDPVKAIQSLSDTQNSVLNKLGELRSLPIYWDELKSEEDTKKFVDTVFRLSLGKEKARLNSKIGQRTPGTWQTILVSASNESLMDTVAYKTRATTAGLYRIFEYTVKPAAAGSPGQIDPTIAQRVVSKLHDNYGMVGKEYAEFLGANHVDVERDLSVLMSELSEEVKMVPDERFWVSLIGTILLGARYAVDLGYADIDQDGLRAFMLATLQEMRGERNAQPVDMNKSVNVVNVLGRFLNEARRRNTIFTDVIWRGKGKPPQGTIKIARLENVQNLEAIHVHVGVDDKVIRIGSSYLSDWLNAHNYPRHVFTKALAEQLGAKTLTARLGSGTTFAGAAEYLIEIDLAGTPLVNFLDEA